MKNGFTTAEGILAFSGLLGSSIVAFIGFNFNWILITAYTFSLAIFFYIYSTRLCKICDKNCPCNPNLKFWKKIVTRQKE